MSFDKNYPNRKDKRKPYHGSKAFDRSCRTGGNCPWCEGNRRVQELKLKEKIRTDAKEDGNE